MFLSLLLILTNALAGLAVTYLFADEESFLWRLCAGNVIGSAIFGTVVFVLSLIWGLSFATASLAFAIALLLLFILRDKRHKARFRRDWRRATDRLQGANLQRALRFSYYALFLLLFLAFFGRAVIETPQGIFTGNAHNMGDLPFHVGAIFSFTEINNFPPQNPSFAGAKFSYPFVADLLVAAHMKFGIGVRDAMLMLNVAWAFSLLVIVERYAFRLVNDRLAAKIVPLLLFFSGGLGFIWFFSDYWSQGKGFFEFLGNLPKDYTIGDQFRWGNSLVTLFMTQRSLLLGMPLTIIVLDKIWQKYSDPRSGGSSDLSYYMPAVVTGMLAGLLPLIHLHSLIVLFVVGVFVLTLEPKKWRYWLAFAAGVAAVAVPELIWSMAGSASDTAKFFEWHFGWDKGEENFVWFWIKNTGLLIFALAAGVWLVYRQPKTPDDNAGSRGSRNSQKQAQPELVVHPVSLLLFYVPFLFLFFVSNAAKLAPWQWDNIKVLIYWFVASIPFAALAIARLWEKRSWFAAAAAVCLSVLVMSGALDVWRIASGQVNHKVFDRNAVDIAERIKTRTEPEALFLNAPTYNSAVVLSGRQSLMRYSGHLSSHGIDYAAREADVQEIYRGGPSADFLLKKYGIDYVILSPEEGMITGLNPDYFRRYSVIAEAGPYRVFKIQQ